MQELIRCAAMEVCGTLEVPYGDLVIDLGKPFRRAPMHELVREATGIDLMTWDKGLGEAREAVAAALEGMGISKRDIERVRTGETTRMAKECPLSRNTIYIARHDPRALLSCATGRPIPTPRVPMRPPLAFGGRSPHNVRL